MPLESYSVNIHHFYPTDPEHNILDEDGDAYLGFYFQFTDLNGIPFTHLMGPYGSAEEAETACQRAWEIGDY